jgi:hypothetical protein
MQEGVLDDSKLDTPLRWPARSGDSDNTGCEAYSSSVKDKTGVKFRQDSGRLRLTEN